MANFNLNKVILGGRLTADPELKMTQSNVPVTSFTIAVNKRSRSGDDGQPQADFIDCVAWRERAEFITRYFHRGSSICIEGSLQKRTWTDQQGQKRYTVEVVVDNTHFVDSRAESGNTYGGGQQSSYTPDTYGAPSYTGGGSANTPAPRFEEISDDDDLPF